MKGKKKCRKVQELNLKQSKQDVEDEINLVVEEDTHKDKGFLLISSNMDYFLEIALFYWMYSF